LLSSRRGGPGSSPGLVMWDLWWTKWRGGRFSSSTSVSPAHLHSTNCSTITISYHLGLVHRPVVAAVPSGLSLTFTASFSSFSVTVNMPYRALKRGLSSRPLQNLPCSPAHCLQQRSTHFSPCASGKDHNVTEHFIYLLYYRGCFWVFVRGGMTLRFQRC
jgi:hypothetical protein